MYHLTPKKYDKRFMTVFYPTGYIVNDSQAKYDPQKMDENSKMAAIGRGNR